jgi:acetylornithine deacetylase/succinyl-diaminopimelate desuccinylase-like protein
MTATLSTPAPVELLQALIRFDTTNPPGNEGHALAWAKEILEQAGLTTQGQSWQCPPFEGRLADGFIWGRGALDMQGGPALYLAAVLRAQVSGSPPTGDILLALVADEEGGGDFGARFLFEPLVHSTVSATIHGADERIPVSALEFGAEAPLPGYP